MQWFTRKTSIVILLVLSAATAFFGWGLSKQGFDYDFEKFFPPGDTETEFFEDFRDKFGNDYDFLFIGVRNPKGIYDTTFLQKIEKITDTLKTVNNVTEVTSLTNLKIPVIVGGGVSYKKYIHLHNDSLLKVDSIKLYETTELTGSFISTDQTTTCIFLQTKEQLSKRKSDDLLLSIEKITSTFGFEEIHMAGKIKAQRVYLSRMQKEILLFLAIAIVLVIIFLAITFQSVSSVVVSLGVVILSIIWQVGIMYFFDKKIDVLLTLLPTILFIVGMSDVIHIISHYIEDLRSGIPKRAAIIKTIKEVGLATFLTSFTTAIGFLTLITSNIAPIREFGLYTAMGVIIAYTLAITMLPSILLLLPPPKLIDKKKFDKRWNNFLHKQLSWIFSNKKLIMGISLTVVLILGGGIYFLKVNNLLLEDLREKEPLKQEFNFFEKNFSGGRPFEMYLEVKNKDANILDLQTIREIEKLETLAIEKFQLGFVQSPITVLKMFNRSTNSGLNEYYRLPNNEKEWEALKQNMLVSGALENPEVEKLISKDQKKCRISGKMHDLGSYKVNKMEEDFIAAAPVLTTIDYRLTGSARLIDKNISGLSISLMQSLGIAILVIAFTFGLLHRSLKMVIVALIPNLIPMICIAGIMGYTGIDIKVSTSLIFTIAFGIAVDDTVHFLSRFKLEQRKGRSTIYAIKRSFLSTGKAMVLTSVILCAGFITMISSSFMSIFYLGLLLSTTLFIALLADLYLLPILLLPKRKKRP